MTNTQCPTFLALKKCWSNESNVIFPEIFPEISMISAPDPLGSLGSRSLPSPKDKLLVLHLGSTWITETESLRMQAVDMSLIDHIYHIWYIYIYDICIDHILREMLDDKLPGCHDVNFSIHQISITLASFHHGCFVIPPFLPPLGFGHLHKWQSLGGKPCETMWNHVFNHVRKHKFWFCTYTDDGTQKRDLTTSPAPLAPLSHFPNWWPVL